MIRHIVIWKLKENAEGASRKENSEKIAKMLTDLKSKIKEIKYLEVGINDHSLPYKNEDVILIADFENAQDLASYQEHPEHKKVAEFIGKVRETRACVDFVI